MTTKRMRVRIAAGLVLLLAGGALAAEPITQSVSTDPASSKGSPLRQGYAGQAAGQDWPQWRGPNRDGVVPSSPKLLDAWPKEGPKLLWKSEPIPSGPKGGAGSITVAGGKAFLFVHGRRLKGKVILTTKDLTDMGWMEGVPDGLVKKIDEAIKPPKWRQLKPGEAMDAYIKEFTATLDPQQAEKFGTFIHDRMQRQPQNWDGLIRLAAIRDKEIPAVEELASFIHLGEHESVYDSAYNTARALLNQRYAGYVDTVVCLDAATGKELWRKEFPGAPTQQASYWGASSTPAVWDNKCYATGSAGLYCLSVQDGAEIWQAKTKFSNSSPLVAEGVVYAMVPALTAYEAGTGKVLWTAGVSNISGSVVPWTCGGRRFVIGHTEDERYGQLFCVDAATGKAAWSAPISGGGSAPVVVGDTVVSRGNELKKFKITPEKAELLWTAKCDHDPGSPMVYQDCVYLTGGHCCPDQVRCLDWNTGQQKWTQWKEEVRCSSPILADGKLFAVSIRSEIVMVRPTPEKYTELGHFNPHVAACTSPTIVGGKLYVRQDNSVSCYDLTMP